MLLYDEQESSTDAASANQDTLSSPAVAPSIVHLCSYFYTSALYARLFEALHATDCQQYVLSPHCIARSRTELNAEVPVISGSQHDWGLAAKVFFGRKVRQYLEFATPHLADKQPSVIHAHSLYSDGLAAARLAQRFNTPYVVTIRDSDVNVHPRFYPHLNKQIRQTLRDAAAVVYVNRSYAKTLANRLRIDVDSLPHHEIPNGADPIWLQLPQATPRSFALSEPLPADAGHTSRPSKVFRIVCTGKLSQQKNQQALLDAVAQCRNTLKDRLDVQVDFYGEAIDRAGEAVLERIAALPWARHLGTRTQAELVELYPSYDLFALTSLAENFGICYPEAVLSGLPVIYTRGQGFDGWQPDSTYGFAVDSHRVDSIATGIMNVLERYPEVCNQQALARKQFDWRIIAATYKGLYQKAETTCGNNRRAAMSAA